MSEASLNEQETQLTQSDNELGGKRKDPRSSVCCVGCVWRAGRHLSVLVPMHVKAVGLPHLSCANGEQAFLCRSPFRDCA